MLTSIEILKSDALPRVQRDPVVPLTRITVFVGPNGSGKSTVVDTLREYVYAPDGAWTDETVPANVEGSCQALSFVSTELENPRLYGKRDASGHQLHPNL